MIISTQVGAPAELDDVADVRAEHDGMIDAMIAAQRAHGQITWNIVMEDLAGGTFLRRGQVCSVVLNVSRFQDEVSA